MTRACHGSRMAKCRNRWRRGRRREKIRAMAELTRVVDELAGRLIRLRWLEPADVDVIREGDRDSDGSRRAGSTHLPYPAFAQRKWWEEDLAKPVEDDSAHLAIETLDGVVVGTIGVARPDRRNGVFGYGIRILAPHGRNGYGTEAVILLLRFYFAELRYQKCDTVVYAFNDASLEFHGRLGFQVEGRRRRGVFTQGFYLDVVLVGRTREEFAERLGL